MTDLRQIDESQVIIGRPGHRATKEARQANLILAMQNAPTIRHAMEATGVAESTLDEWKRNTPTFLTSFNQAKKRITQRKNTDLVTFDPFREFDDPGPLVEWRQDVFGFPSTPTQQDFAKAYDDKTNLVIFWVAAAGAGKDVTAMQAVTHAAADQIDLMGCIMENEKQAKKRIDAYLDPYFTDPNLFTRAPAIPNATVPVRNFIEEYGPFKFDKNLRLPDGSRPATTKWDAHNKWFVGRTTVAADPSLWAVGLGSAIAGARVRLLVASDLFTVENQRSATFREEQLALITGTVQSRLDESGRLIFLNHHVRRAGESNLVTLMEQYIGTARIVKQERHYTKYANGVAVVRTPALEVNDEGIVVSYWPERFPVKGKFVIDNEIHEIDNLSNDEYQDFTDRGARRLRGLVDIRDSIGEDLFELLYQQNPKTSGYGDFTDEILDACDDPSRTLGQFEPDEIRMISTDPARNGGAAWVALGINPKTEEFTVVDFWIGDGLGYSGMLDVLIRQPIEKHRPTEYVWEENYEADLPHSPEAQEFFRRHHVRYTRWWTQYNRSQGDFQVLSMLQDMRTGKFKFPAKTMADKIQCKRLKDHFQAFESSGYTDRKKSRGVSRVPDDGCLATWFGWATGHEILKSRKKGRKRSRIGASQGVNDAFSGYQI